MGSPGSGVPTALRLLTRWSPSSRRVTLGESDRSLLEPRFLLAYSNPGSILSALPRSRRALSGLEVLTHAHIRPHPVVDNCRGGAYMSSKDARGTLCHRSRQRTQRRSHMRPRNLFLVALLAIALLGMGGVLLATVHSIGTTPTSPTASVSSLPDGMDHSSSIEPVTSCTGGCRAICTSPGEHTTCGDGSPCVCQTCDNGGFVCIRQH